MECPGRPSHIANNKFVLSPLHSTPLRSPSALASMFDKIAQIYSRNKSRRNIVPEAWVGR